MNENKLKTLAELAMMGIVVEIREKDDINFAADYIKKACGLDDAFPDGTAYDRITKYCSDSEETEIYGISCSTVCEMPVINILFRDKEEPFVIDSDDGVFCYVLNMEDSYCSEYGYSFFEKKGEYYHRIA